MTDPGKTLQTLRKALLWILLLAMTGTAGELFLLQHTEDASQLIPLSLIGAAYIVIGWNALEPSRLSITVMRLLMGLFVVSGVLGLYFHYNANLEFQQEMEPTLSGSNLLLKVLRAKTPPALAPGVMVQLGLIGLAYTYRQPLPAQLDLEGEKE